MDEKNKRHKSLVKLLSEKDFKKQDDVVREMTRLGFEVTQSSISRDFRELGVVKIVGIYRPSKVIQEANLKRSFLQNMILSINSAGHNLMVIKTSTGAAAAVAEEIDVEDIGGVVGTVAGDNTIFVATKNKTAQTKVLEKIRIL